MNSQRFDGLSVRDRKIMLRKEYSEKRKNLPPEEKAEMDNGICRRLASLPEFLRADTVFSYMPLKNEVDVSGFNRFVLESGKTLALPRCIPGTPIMEFRTVNDVDGLKKGSFSIREPDEGCPLWNPGEGNKKENVFCVIPGMAYDLYGNRLGYGKGYYDRFLSSHNVVRAGVAYAGFVVGTLPKGRYDLEVDLIVTEKRVIKIK